MCSWDSEDFRLNTSYMVLEFIQTVMTDFGAAPNMWGEPTRLHSAAEHFASIFKSYTE